MHLEGFDSQYNALLSYMYPSCLSDNRYTYVIEHGAIGFGGRIASNGQVFSHYLRTTDL